MDAESLAGDRSPALVRRGDGWTLKVGGRPVVLLGGELHNSSASSMAYLEPVLDRLVALNLNTVLAPLYWELIEPVEGRFEFDLLDGLVRACRQRGLMLVPLWFGALKNAISCYAPAWVRTDTRRFFRSQAQPPRSSWAVSVFCADLLAADARAFAAVMRRLGGLDPQGRTVVMVQVENEPGMLGAPRDRCPAAEKAFAAAVPAELMEQLRRRGDRLHDAVAGPWREAGGRQEGDWAAVFGKAADEVFMAWHVGRYVDQVAAAGRAACDRPMFANAWLVSGSGYLPGKYPSGGPVPGMLDVWKAAGRHLEVLAPDIYKPQFRAECGQYHRPDNPLVIPETRSSAVAVANALYSIGAHEALLFAPFGIDDLAIDHPLGELYGVLREAMPMLVEAYGQGRLAGLVQEADDEALATELAGYRIKARVTGPMAEGRTPGAVMFPGDDAGLFHAIGVNLVLTFDRLCDADTTAEVLWLETGQFRNGRWQTGRRLNGDETFHHTGVKLDAELTMVRFRLHHYR